jgi:DNA repair exonuclease SbcCD nuclease subunit
VHVLHVTDTHLGAEGRARGAPPGWTRASDHLSSLRTALEPVERGEVDLVLHTGDLFDRSRPPRAAVSEATALLSAVARRVPVVVIPGNHDRRGLLGHLARTARLHVCDAAEALQLGEVRIGVVPFCRHADAWADAAAMLGRVDLLGAHQAFDGAKVPGFTFRDGRQADTVGARHLPASLRHVACGHLHPRQVLTLGGATVVCTGSTERTSGGEGPEAKGYAIWSFGASISWRWVDLPARRVVRVVEPADVGRVRDGTLVHLAPGARTTEVEGAVLARGGWLTGPPAGVQPARRPTDSGQVGLFA